MTMSTTTTSPAQDTPNYVGTIVVTGAAGDLGRNIAASLMSQGHHISALDRNSDALNAVSEEWTTAGMAERFTTYTVDQTDRAHVEATVAQVDDAAKGIVGLVANAGYVRFGGFLDMPAATWGRHVEINLTGTFHMCQVTAQYMAAARRGGWITVISSNLALSHADQTAAYCVTKAALLTMVRSAAAELGVHRIRVNALLPGVVETSMTKFMLDAPGVRDGLLADTPLGRLGNQADVSEAVLFLASDKASWVTGASLLVDGGQSIYGAPAWLRQDRRTPHDPAWLGRYGDV